MNIDHVLRRELKLTRFYMKTFRILTIVLALILVTYWVGDLLMQEPCPSTDEVMALVEEVRGSSEFLEKELAICVGLSKELDAQFDTAMALNDMCIDSLEECIGIGKGEVDFGNEGRKFNILWGEDNYVHTYELQVRDISQSY
jgi:hypothetical protein